MSDIGTPAGFDHEIDSRVVADRMDGRDLDYVASSSVPVPAAFELPMYRELADETWHQRGQECTGFALAAVANYLIRSDDPQRTAPSVSRRMLYEMAQVYDGEMHVHGSTLRGALKGWNRVGVAADALWPYDPDDEHGEVHGGLTLARLLDARSRPLRGYYRIAGEDIETMQRALFEGRPLYAASRTHVGWYRLFLADAGDVIEQREDDDPRGVHAFVIMGYDEQGFWIQNSWGPEWGDDGYAVLPYDQWEWGATDAWVADAGIEPAATRVAPRQPPATTIKTSYRDLWQHLVVLRDDGRLATTGLYEMDEGSVKTMLYLFDEYTTIHRWGHRKVAVVSDGGAWSPGVTIERIEQLRQRLLADHIYPFFVLWETPWHADLDHEVRTWSAHLRAGSVHDIGELELARSAAALGRGQQIWASIVHRSERALFDPQGGARLLRNSIAYKRGQRDFDVHTVSFGAGDQLLAPLAHHLPTPITSALAVEPTLTVEQFHHTHGELLNCGCLRHLTVLTNSESSNHGPFGGVAMAPQHFVGDVWAHPGRVMREAGRAARRSGEWNVPGLAMLGIAADIAADVGIGQHRATGRLSLRALPNLRADEVLRDPRVHDLVIEQLTTRRAVPGPVSVEPTAEPRDPLAAAEFRRSSRH